MNAKSGSNQNVQTLKQYCGSLAHIYKLQKCNIIHNITIHLLIKTPFLSVFDYVVQDPHEKTAYTKHPLNHAKCKTFVAI